MTDARTQLIDFIRSEAVFHGDFTLTSGRKATYYIDLRKVSLDHRIAPLIGDVMLDLIAPIPDVFAVGGLTMGADPIASAILHRGVLRGAEVHAYRQQSSGVLRSLSDSDVLVIVPEGAEVPAGADVDVLLL